MESVLVTLGRCLYLFSSVSVWPYIPQENCLTMANLQTYSDKTKLITKNDQKNRPRDPYLLSQTSSVRSTTFKLLVGNLG